MNGLRARSLVASSAAAIFTVALGACTSETTITESNGCGFGAFGGSCGSSPSIGILATIATTGSPAGNSPYTLRVSRDGCAISHQVDRNEMGRFLSVCGDGPNTVELRDLPQGCAVDGANPRTIDVQTNGWNPVHFAVSCS